MTREELKEMMPVIQTYVDGKKIEIIDKEEQVETNEMYSDNIDDAIDEMKEG